MQKPGNGTPTRTRTVDILIKSEALYQLSYGRIPMTATRVDLAAARRI